MVSELLTLNGVFDAAIILVWARFLLVPLPGQAQ